jgi:hypothetical protein
MSSKRLPASGAEGQTGIDNFQLVRGIGPGIEQRLHNAGILTFAELAALTPNDIAALLTNIAGLSAERVVKLAWIEQAQALASEHAANNRHSLAETAVSIRQVASSDHYQDLDAAAQRQHLETFTVELLLDEENQVRRTSLVHIQAWKKESWAGWDESRVVRFLIEQAGLPGVTKQVSAPDQNELSPVVATLSKPQESVVEAEPEPLVAAVVEAEPLVAAVAEAGSDPSDTTAQISTPVLMEVRPLGELRLSKLETLPAGANESTSFISSAQPFEVRLTLDMLHAAESHPQQFDYRASVYAKSLSSRNRYLVGEVHGALTLGATGTVRLPGATLAPGIYRLEAAVTLSTMPMQPGLKTNFSAMLEGGILRIH